MENLSLNDRADNEVRLIGKLFTKLHYAALKGDANEVAELINNGYDVDIAVPRGIKKGCTPLHFATEFKHLNVMKTLLGLGADFTLKNDIGETPLQIARILEWDEAIDLIVKALCTACSKINENTRAVFASRQLLTDFDIKISERFRKNFEPISFAAQCGLEEIVIALISHGFDIETRDSDGMTELHRIVRRITEFKQPNLFDLSPSPDSDVLTQLIIRSLMEKCRDIKDPADNHGRTPLFYMYKGLPERKLSQHFTSGMMIRMCWTRVYLLQQMLQTPALVPNFSAPDCEGNTILHTVARAPLSSYPYIEASVETSFIVKQYLADGGDIDVLNPAGYTPLHCSCRHINVKVALVLLKNGADINALTIGGDTPYSILCKSEFTWTYERLIIFSFVKRLVILGAPLCPLNARLYKRDNYIWLNAAADVKRTILDEEECRTEVKRLKNERIDNFITVYDFLLRSAHHVMNYVRNEKITRKDFEKDFPIFGYLVKSKIDKVEKRAALIEPAKEALLETLQFDFPDACLHAILAHFDIYDMKQLINVEENEKE